ncbi:hypothetical protein [Gordonia aurantiaca]|uniref:hypothetical protein n=1 Tax=Gordonia sp. B21 TaxID=3151852 RepID=UPI003264552D
MTSTLSARAARRSVRKFLEPAAIAEAIAIEELIISPGYRALAIFPATFELSKESIEQVDEAIRRHRAIVQRLRKMYSDAVAAELASSPRRETMATLGLAEPDRTAPMADLQPQPVQVYRSVQIGQNRHAEPEFKAIIAAGFLLVALHAVTDPTNCGTASPALNLVPPPLHRDRALLEEVLTRAVKGFSAVEREALESAITEAGASFAPYLPEKQTKLSVIRFNPHSLRGACRTIGLEPDRLDVAS